MDFTTSDEHRMLRETAAKIAAGFGHDYYVQQSREGGDAAELWQAMADAGFVGANTPEAYGGSGLGLQELAIMGEEMAAAGCPSPMSVISPAIVASVLVGTGRTSRSRRSCRGWRRATPTSCSPSPSPMPGRTPTC